jgi:quercetin dioxygenase-like cupin family protein
MLKNNFLFSVGKEVAMKRMAYMLALALVVGIVMGVVGNQFLNAQQQPVKRTELLRTDLPGIEGKEGIVYIAELAPGAAAGKHYHPGSELFYVLEGSMILEVEGKPPATMKQGDVSHLSPKEVHDVKNASATAPMKALIFQLPEKGQPLVTPVR